jgi:hypothetical protein
MDDLNDIKAIWHSAKVDGLPTSDEIRQIVRKYRRQKLTGKAVAVAVALALLGVVAGAVFFYPSVLPSTRWGEACILVAIAILVANNTRSLFRVYGLKNLSNKEFLQYLELAQQGHIRFYKRTQVVGLAFNSVGLLLYLYEFVHKSLTASVIVYGLTVLYLLAVWLILRPRLYQRRKKKFDALRERVDKISGQL